MLYVLFKDIEVMLNFECNLTFYDLYLPIDDLYLCSIPFNLQIYIPFVISFYLIPNMICLYHKLDKT